MPPPSPRTATALVYDSARNVLVAFGGRTDGNILSGETFEWDGTHWHLLSTTGPSPRAGHSMVYNSSLSMTMLFGGTANDGPKNDLWAWNGAVWTLVDDGKTNAPAPQPNPSMAYDSARDVVVMFGVHAVAPDAPVETWEWDGIAWNIRSTAGPSPRVNSSMTFDIQRAKTVLFGGVMFASSNAFNDTWEWDGTSWMQRDAGGPTSPNRPSTRFGSAFAYDNSRGVSVLHGGILFSGIFDTPTSNETWEWDGAIWTIRDNAIKNGLYARGDHAMAYDSARHVVVRFAGFTYCPEAFPCELTADVMEWNGIEWRPSGGPPLQRSNHTMSFDRDRNVFVMFGGYMNGRLNDTWEWDGANWQFRSLSGPPRRLDSAQCYDELHQVTVLHGGNGAGPIGLGDTWLWNGDTWTNTGAAGPVPVRSGHSMVYDSVRHVVLLFGGNELDDTWGWDGTVWTQLASSGPPKRFLPSMAFDRARGVAVLFGGYYQNAGSASSYTRDDTWEWNGTMWTQIGTTGPSSRYGATMIYDESRQRLILFGGATTTDGSIVDEVLDDVWEYQDGVWTNHTANYTVRPSARAFHAMAHDPSHQQTLLFGGDYDVDYSKGFWQLSCRRPCISSLSAEPCSTCSPGSNATSNRFLSFQTPAVPDDASALAFRITLQQLPDARACTNIPDFSGSNGTWMWVGDEILHGSSSTGVFRLHSTSKFMNRNSLPATIRVSDCNIVPCATYSVQAVSDADCDTLSEESFSATLELETSAWGDVVGSNDSEPPNGIANIIDVAAIVDCFKEVPAAPPKTWCDLDPDGTGQMNLTINISDVAAGVDAFKGLPYLLQGPTAPLACP